MAYYTISRIRHPKVVNKKIRSPGVAELVLAGRCRDVDLVPQDDRGPGFKGLGIRRLLSNKRQALNPKP